MNGLVRDLRHAIRGLRVTPLFTLTAILVLGLGIGVSASMLSIVNAVLFARLPVREPAELVNIYRSQGTGRQTLLSYADYVDVRDAAIVRDALGYSLFRAAIQSPTTEDLVFGELVTPNYFAALGVTPALGRVWHEATSESDAPVAVISDLTWQRLYHGKADVIGQTLWIDNVPFTVIGVAPRAFKGLNAPGLIECRFWIPLAQAPRLRGEADFLTNRNHLGLVVKARLEPPLNLAGAQATLQALAQRLEAAYPSLGDKRQFLVRPTSDVRMHESGDAIAVPIAIGVLVMAGLVLAIAVCNVSYLALARAAARASEMATRRALGASGLALTRLIVLESAILATLGGVVGLAIAAVTPALVRAFGTPPMNGITFSLQPAIDLRLVTAVALIAWVTALVFSLGPVRLARRVNLTRLLNAGAVAGATPARQRELRHVLIVPQVALSSLVLLVAALFVRSAILAAANDPGFDIRRTALVSLSMGEQQPESDARHALEALVARARSLPAVTQAGAIDRLPLGMDPGTAGLVREEDRGASRDATKPVGLARVSPTALDTLGIRVLQGQGFVAHEAPDRYIALVSQSGARQLWPGRDAIGQRFRLVMGRRTSDASKRDRERVFEVIGITSDTDVFRVGERSVPMIYTRLDQDLPPAVSVIVRVDASNPAAAVPHLRQLIRESGGGVSVRQARTLSTHVGESMYVIKAGAAVLLGAGGLGFVLALAGLFAVITYMVSRRTREIGIRMALGATRSQVLGLIVGDGARMVIIGLALAIGGFILVGPIARSLVLGVLPLDALTLIAVPSALAVAAIAACWLPARRAVAHAPSVTLREL